MTEGYDYQQLMYRNQHGGVKFEDTKESQSRTIKKRIRATIDSRLWGALESDGLAEACETIEGVYRTLTVGMAARSLLDAITSRGRGGSMDDYGAALQSDFRLWVDRCRAKHYSPLIAIDIIGHGMSLEESDRHRGFRNGTARIQLFNCLRVWVEMAKTPDDIERV